ncbi:MAG: S46 family peptidase [Gemmatimonadales bacterium]
MPVRKPLSYIIPAVVAASIAGCASGAAKPAQVAAVPQETLQQFQALPETVVVRVPSTEVIPVEPGQFDLGKMWTFENPPLDYFQEAYGFRPSQEWLEQSRLAALRLPNCTASFVSPNGLVMSNHHCAREGATAVSRDEEDLLTNGFYAKNQDDERKVPDLYVDQLVQTRDVTDQVTSSVDETMTQDAQVRSRNQVISGIADSASSASGLRCDVTTLYNGGKYSLYCYRRYDDVRLVFVPETQIGYFGGDPDNFTYPRYVVDVSFFRVYDPDGNPVKPSAYFRWSKVGAKEGEPVFVIGNPGSTSRLSTVSQLEYRRDMQYPFTIRLLESRAQILWQYMEHHPDERDEYINDYFSLKNSLKSFTGELEGLRNPQLMGRKVGFEQQFREAVESDSGLARQYGGLWDEITGIRKQIAEVAPNLNGLNQGGLLRSKTLETATTMIQYAQAALSGRVPDSILRPVRQELERVSINTALEPYILGAQLEDALALLGKDDPFVQHALGERSPIEAARSIIEESNAVTDSAARSAMLADPSTMVSSTAPALSLMRDALPRLISMTQQYQQLIQAEQVRTAKLARALFDIYGTDIPPDATFTLRIADGVIRSYDYNGTHAPAYTTFYGMYDRHYSNPDDDTWELPDRWLNPPSDFPMRTPLNMVSTNDIIGGNSGSPVINKNREIVGLIFDGNIESLPGDFIYTTEKARSISVRTEAIVAALTYIYHADRIAQELLSTVN